MWSSTCPTAFYCFLQLLSCATSLTPCISTSAFVSHHIGGPLLMPTTTGPSTCKCLMPCDLLTRCMSMHDKLHHSPRGLMLTRCISMHDKLHHSPRGLTPAHCLLSPGAAIKHCPFEMDMFRSCFQVTLPCHKQCLVIYNAKDSPLP